MTGFTRFTEKARKVMDLSFREALSLGHNYIATEHILLALLRQEDTVAYKVLNELGGEGGVDAVRKAVIEAVRAPISPKAADDPGPEFSLVHLLRRAADMLEAREK